MNKQTNRVAIVIAAVAIQLCLGVAYIWSVFQTGIAQSIFGGDNTGAGLTYSLLLFILTVGSVFGGKLAAKHGTRKVVIIGGIILASGFFLASTATAENPWILWLTYGAMGGIGMGFTYSTTIACAQKWFPQKKGLITGIIVAALGMGGVVFTPMIETLIANFGGTGVGEMQTFFVLGFIFLGVCTVGGLFLKDAPEATPAANANAPAVINYTPSQMLKTPQFYLIAIAMMLACMGGLMMIGFAKPIAVARGMGEAATIGVLLISIFNSVGRLLWGIISDKLGRTNTLIILLAGTVILTLLVNAATGYLIFVLIGCIGFFYGGLLSNFPSLTADIYGPKNLATNYGFVLLGFGVGAVVSSYIAGYFKNIAEQDISLMFPAFVIAAACAAIAVVFIIIIKKSKPKAPQALAQTK